MVQELTKRQSFSRGRCFDPRLVPGERQQAEDEEVGGREAR